jgi:hypothetical protein
MTAPSLSTTEAVLPLRRLICTVRPVLGIDGAAFEAGVGREARDRAVPSILGVR